MYVRVRTILHHPICIAAAAKAINTERTVHSAHAHAYSDVIGSRSHLSLGGSSERVPFLSSLFPSVSSCLGRGRASTSVDGAIALHRERIGFCHTSMLLPCRMPPLSPSPFPFSLPPPSHHFAWQFLPLLDGEDRGPHPLDVAARGCMHATREKEEQNRWTR